MHSSQIVSLSKVTVFGRGLRRLKLPNVFVITYVMLIDTYFGELTFQCVSTYGIFLRIQSGARKTGPPSRRTTWAQVSDSVQEIRQMQMQSTYWLEKVLKTISLYVNALLCTLQHIVMQLSGVNSPN